MNKTVNIIPTVLTITTAQSVVADHIQYSPSETPYPLGQGVAALSNDCDKASAHPYDPMRTEFSGVKFSDINPDLAEKACKEWANVVIQKYKNKKPLNREPSTTILAQIKNPPHGRINAKCGQSIRCRASSQNKGMMPLP